MATTLTIPQQISATRASIDNLQLTLARNSDNTVNVEGSTFSVDLVFRDSNNRVLSQTVVTMTPAELPAAVRNAARALLSAVTTALRNSGQLPAGTDVQDI